MSTAAKLAAKPGRLRSIQIETPPMQNWSCHSCTGCCRGHWAVAISVEEKQRIEKQAWTLADGVDPEAMIVEEGSRFRLAHQRDGACVFLDPAGRCRIHARFGEEAKPLACRLYPFAIHPAGKKLVVSLRFDCPSVADNRGHSLPEQATAIRRLAELMVPDDFDEERPPPVLSESCCNWPDVLRYVKHLDQTVAAPDVPVALKLLRALHWLKAVETGHFDQLTGAGADEILGALTASAAKKLSDLAGDSAPPSRFGRMLFRTLLFEYAYAETCGARAGQGRWWRRLWDLARFACGAGSVSTDNSERRRVAFSAVETAFGPLPPEAEALLTRFLRVKIQGLHFCGRAYYGTPLVEGFQSLVLLIVAILWLSRWRAVAEGRSNLSLADVSRAVGVADHFHGYSHRLGSRGARRRVRLLAQRDDIPRLCQWYSR